MLLLWLVRFALLTAAVTDLRRRVVPNWLTLPALTLGLAAFALRGGVPGLLYALGGAAIPAAIFGLPWLLGGFGGGDFKKAVPSAPWAGRCSPWPPSCGTWCGAACSSPGGWCCVAGGASRSRRRSRWRCRAQHWPPWPLSCGAPLGRGSRWRAPWLGSSGPGGGPRSGASSSAISQTGAWGPRR